MGSAPVQRFPGLPIHQVFNPIKLLLAVPRQIRDTARHESHLPGHALRTVSQGFGQGRGRIGGGAPTGKVLVNTLGVSQTPEYFVNSKLQQLRFGRVARDLLAQFTDSELVGLEETHREMAC